MAADVSADLEALDLTTGDRGRATRREARAARITRLQAGRVAEAFLASADRSGDHRGVRDSVVVR